MGVTAAIIAGVGVGISVVGQVKSGSSAKSAGQANAMAILETSEQNAQLIEQGAELNASTNEFNAKALEYQATDAVARGVETETKFRQQLRGFIGAQRAGYAGQGVEVNADTSLDMQADTAYQGELDAITIRTNAAREAWGLKTQATGERLQAAAVRKLGALQAKNTRAVGVVEARNAVLGGNYAASASNWGAASTILSSAGSFAAKYGFNNSTKNPAGLNPRYTF